LTKSVHEIALLFKDVTLLDFLYMRARARVCVCVCVCVFRKICKFLY